ncbi:MAG: alanine--tRNA ligase [Devosiaceae bacterium]|nr:alanine--tRNA ligase [Devosiaceae bacterium]
MSSVNDIRRTFIDYFSDRDHTIVPSAALVPNNDPTLMFTNSGMVQFKNMFTGVEKRSYTRAVSAQKCVRAGGKHNDLDNVGKTARHLTFFEMLGNFSFGDYFKEQAIEMAWKLITDDFGIAKERLVVTVYHEDDDAFRLWKKIAGLSEDRIIRIATDDNFWSMGDTGPCGPSTEIFFDYGDKFWGGPPGTPEEDGDRFIEIWNLVFTQFDQQTDGSRLILPRPCVDTGMGLERISALLQGTNNVFETDLFATLVESAAQVTGSGLKLNNLVSQRVMADHLRTMSFLIAEGVLPSNEGRGYVLRRIMRRAMRHATLLGASAPSIYKMVPVLVQEMGQAYPELVHGQNMICETVRLEEERFLKTLSRGLQILKDETDGFGAGDVLSGEAAFKLYDTYGFPLDLTEDALRSREVLVDHEGFEAAMAAQKAIARASWSGSGSAADDAIWFQVAEKNDPSEFLGYDSETAEAQVVALVRDGKLVKKLDAGQEGYLVCNQTPFYAESGGQVGDRGYISADNCEGEIVDVQRRAGGIVAHQVMVHSGSLSLSEAVQLIVDTRTRMAIRSNHSATHLLHAALRKILGEHVVQKGSLVNAERLRFDFAHNKPVTEEQIFQIEHLANEIILQNGLIKTQLMGVDEAREAGAMALFGEKYGDEVRVVSMGRTLNGDDSSGSYSMELCGGTHASRTGAIGLGRVVQESSVAAGVRRIEALTGARAREHLVAQEENLKSVAALLKSTPAKTYERVLTLIDERKGLERQLSEARQKLALGGSEGDQQKSETVAGVAFSGRVIEGLQPKELRGLIDQTKTQLGSGVVVVVGISDEGKAAIAVGVTKDLTERHSAVDLVRVGAAALGGKGGGGRPDMAQAGGPDASKGEAALEAIRDVLKG